MDGAPEIVSTIAELRARLSPSRKAGGRIGLVPTMGALHEGHLSLVRETKARRALTVVSVFVNPAQFGPKEDFTRYPRTLESDCAKLTGLADVVFTPSVSEMYPDGFATRIEVGGPALGLESDFRPHFFSGVATVVTKLLLAVMTDEATFGEKDYQQLLVIRHLVADLRLPLEIVAGRTVREPDGLAMSSRNAYLSADERLRALALSRALLAARETFEQGERDAARLVDCARATLHMTPGVRLDYLELRDAESLAELHGRVTRPAVMAVAAFVGSTRLIDNQVLAP